MTKLLAPALCLALAAAVLGAGPAAAQLPSNVAPRPVGSGLCFNGLPVPPLAAGVVWQQSCLCDLAGPAEVQGYRVQCTNATFLDVHVSDCCVVGDHWQLKSKNWDNRPNTAVTTSPGPVVQFGVPGRVYNYGGTAQNPGNLDAYVECTYLHGVDIFGASSFLSFSSNGACVVTPDAVRSRIDRTP
ncbi:MAG TPA: hypothetical protein VGX68_08900 [Thermoanaerobaculia bacterium]|jgi:hypothetical protein|nr:hypothetical protein [Thermoanaerobaculia bacterium]